MRTLCVWLTLGCLALPVQALELAVNGGFEEPLASGWRQETQGSAWTIDRATTYDPDPDYEASVRQNTGSGSARLCQDVVLPSTDVEFSVRARIQATATATAWAGAAVVLSYLDQLGSPLGETYICVKTLYCPWTDTPTTHLIFAPVNTWHDCAFNLADELANLPGVSPAAIHSVQVSLLVRAADC